jgi:predicted phosphodiesterase
MRIAVLSDIHGVLPALEAVLAEPDVAAADRIVLSGDIAAGPQPVETLDRLAGLGERAVWVRGNADRWMATLARGGEVDVPDPVIRWAAAQLRPDQVELLAGLPLTAVLEPDGVGPTVFCHGTPRDDNEVVLVDSRPQRWAEVFDGLAPEIAAVACGHTHMPFARLVDRRLVLNPGSVGMPYGGAGAHWALLGGPGQVSLRVTSFDLDAACERIAAESGYPGAAAFADDYVRSRASDLEALAVFGPRDGRDSSGI